MKGGGDVSLDISVWFWHFVGKQKENGFLKSTILNISDLL
jgi:hypothetical protein